jgi:hypothetical protein
MLMEVGKSIAQGRKAKSLTKKELATVRFGFCCCCR